MFWVYFFAFFGSFCTIPVARGPGLGSRNGTVGYYDENSLGKPFCCCVLAARKFPPSEKKEDQWRVGSEIGLDLIS